jgi:hypothetical protein
LFALSLDRRPLMSYLTLLVFTWTLLLALRAVAWNQQGQIE